MEDGDPPDPAAIAAAFRLRGEIGDLQPVAGAWSNRMYRLDVGGERFAVKEVLDRWHEPAWLARLDEAWAFELVAIDAGVAAPEPIPNPAHGGWRADVERSGGSGIAHVRVHRWVDGTVVAPGVATDAMARWCGTVLATLHGLDHTPSRPEVFPGLPGLSTAAADRWRALVEVAAAAGVPWLALARAATPAVEAIRRLAADPPARSLHEVMSHRDIDQKNLLRTAAGPVLCDWDVAGPVDPRAELVDVALSMARWESPAIARAVIEAYRLAGGDDIVPTAEDVTPMLFSSVNWLVFNAERSLGVGEIDAEQQRQGDDLVPELLARLPRRVEQAEQIGRWLASGD